MYIHTRIHTKYTYSRHKFNPPYTMNLFADRIPAPYYSTYISVYKDKYKWNTIHIRKYTYCI